MTTEDELAEFGVEELEQIAPILMAAAQSDGDYGGSEMRTIRGLLEGQLGGERLPTSVLERLVNFHEEEFDLEASCRDLDMSSHRKRRALLELLARVVGADNVFHVTEEAYFHRVATLIGAAPEEYESLIEELEELPAWFPEE